MRKQKGFSLIELLIVVAIILIIAAIAIPNLLKSRIAANEASAVGATRTIVTAELTYFSTNPETGYIELPQLYGAGLIDSVLGAGTKSGYTFAATPGHSATSVANDQFVIITGPTTVGTTGNRFFCAIEDGVLKPSNQAITARAGCTGLTSVLQ